MKNIITYIYFSLGRILDIGLFSFFFSSKRGGDECANKPSVARCFGFGSLIFRTPILRREARGAVPQGTFPTPNIEPWRTKHCIRKCEPWRIMMIPSGLAVTKEYVYSAGYDGKISEWT